MFEISRRDLLRSAALTGVGAVVETAVSAGEALAADPAPQGASMRGIPFAETKVARIGIIGVGGRGYSLLARGRLVR